MRVENFGFFSLFAICDFLAIDVYNSPKNSKQRQQNSAHPLGGANLILRYQGISLAKLRQKVNQICRNSHFYVYVGNCLQLDALHSPAPQ